MATCSSSRSCGTPRAATEPPYRERLVAPSFLGHGPAHAASPSPARADPGEVATRLKRRDEYVGASGSRQVLGERGEEPGGDPTSVGTPIEREILPHVRVAFATGRREIRRVREDQVEPAKSRRQVGADCLQEKAFRSSALKNSAQRGGVQVGGDDAPGPASCRSEARQSSTASHLENRIASPGSNEPDQHPGILADRIHLNSPPCATSGPS